MSSSIPDDASTLAQRARQALDEVGLTCSPDSVAGLVAYTQLLCRHGARTNLVGTTDPVRVLDEMVIDSAALASLLPSAGRLVDIGTGAGLPGLPLLLVLERWSGVLVEPRQRRAFFLRTARRAVCPTRCEVLRGRLEAGRIVGVEDGAPSPEAGFDLAVSKAVFAPGEWVAQATPLVRDGGRIGIYASGDIDRVTGELKDAGVPPPDTHRTYRIHGGPVRTVAIVAAPPRQDAI